MNLPCKMNSHEWKLPYVLHLKLLMWQDNDLDMWVLHGSCLILLRGKWCPSCFMLFTWEWLFSWQLVPWCTVRAFSLLTPLASVETHSCGSGRWERRLLFLSPSPIKQTDKKGTLLLGVFTTFKKSLMIFVMSVHLSVNLHLRKASPGNQTKNGRLWGLSLHLEDADSKDLWNVRNIACFYMAITKKWKISI